MSLLRVCASLEIFEYYSRRVRLKFESRLGNNTTLLVQIVPRPCKKLLFYASVEISVERSATNRFFRCARRLLKVFVLWTPNFMYFLYRSQFWLWEANANLNLTMKKAIGNKNYVRHFYPRARIAARSINPIAVLVFAFETRENTSVM